MGDKDIPTILEVKMTIKTLINSGSTGPDNVNAELLNADEAKQPQFYMTSIKLGKRWKCLLNVKMAPVTQFTKGRIAEMSKL